MKIVLEIETRDGYSLNEAQKLINSLINGDVTTEVEEKQVEATPETPEKPVEPKTTPKPRKTTPKPKKDVEKPVEETKDAGISLADLKDSAKDAVGRTDREKVKNVISEFAPKLAEVDTKDFGKLYKKLQELS